MLLILFPTLLITVVLSASVHDNIIGTRNYVKRQVSLDDIIQGALNFVRPIIDSSQSLQSDFTTSKKSESVRERDAEILGAPKYSALDDIPICKSNSRICKFISCSAHNFQNDESLSNLNLAVQILSDTKLRKAITNDPSLLLTVCHEQGLSTTQCKLFANAFQLIDRFISTIEPVGMAAKKLNHYIIKGDPYYDDWDAPPIPIKPGAYENVGSQTWSTHENNISDPNLMPSEMQAMEKPEPVRLKQLDSVLSDITKNSRDSHLSNLNTTTTSILENSALTNEPSSSTTSAIIFTFPPLFFTFPTLATFAPMMPIAVPPTGMGLQMSPPINLIPKELQNLMFGNKLLSPNMMQVSAPETIQPVHLKSTSTVKSVRSRRSSDYYDNIEEEDDASKATSASGHNIVFDDHQHVTKHKKSKANQKGLLDCIRILED